MKASAGKRVLMLLENNPYPQDPRVRRECQALLAAGYRVCVIAPRGPRQPMSEIVDDIAVRRYPSPPESAGAWSYLWEYVYSLLAIFLISLRIWITEGFDVVHAANPPDTLFFVGAFYKLFGKRYIFDHHDLSPELYDARFGAKRMPLIRASLVLLEKLSCRTADVVIATNQSYRQMEIERGRVPEERIAIVRNGPETSCFPAPTQADPPTCAPFTIAYAGMMSPQDGLDYLLRSLRHLIADFGRTDFRCILIGGRGDARPYLERLTRELGLEPYVSFTGWVSDVDYRRYILSADICVDPDPSNPFNDRSSMNKIVEYMACGKPIVAFNLPEHRYTAQEAAIYVTGNDEMSFARAIAALMDDPERRHKMGAIALARFTAHLSWERSAERLLAAYGLLSLHSTAVPCPASERPLGR